MTDKHREILTIAEKGLLQLKGSVMDFIALNVKGSDSLAYVKHLSRIISKLSPIIGNMLEYEIVEYLNKITSWKTLGKWKRQDPGFPDTIFEGKVSPTPGIEIKTWFPLATEITARFRETITHFSQDQTDVALIAWLPEKLFFGKPKIIDVFVDSAYSLALARDQHYHNPPDYLVIEPEDTSARTSNLQQTNTNGYKFQGNKTDFDKAKAIVASWGKGGQAHSPSSDYQTRLRALLGRFKYRLDTNFAKIDRIQHDNLENFKRRILDTEFEGKRIFHWSKLLTDHEKCLLVVNTLKEGGVSGKKLEAVERIAKEKSRIFEIALSQLTGKPLTGNGE